MPRGWCLEHGPRQERRGRGENGHGMDGDGMEGPEEIAATTGDHDLASAEGVAMERPQRMP